jgi:hypothetical protein
MNLQTHWRWRIVAKLEVGIGRRIGRRILTRPLHCSLPLRTNRNSQCEGGVIIKICTFAFVQVGCRVLFHNSQQSQVDKTRDSHHCVFPLAFAERSSEALGFAEASEGMGNDVHRHVVLPSDERDWWDDGYYLIGCRGSFPRFPILRFNASRSHAIRRFW